MNQEVMRELETPEGRVSVCRVAEQMAKSRYNVVGVSYVQEFTRKIVKEVWKSC